jgi:hypothetical protein
LDGALVSAGSLKPSAPESIPVDGTMFYVWEVQNSNLLCGSNTKKIQAEQKTLTCSFAEQKNM